MDRFARSEPFDRFAAWLKEAEAGEPNDPNAMALATADAAALLPVFWADKVAIVEDADGTFLGMITKVDLINHLRRKLG